MGGSPLPARPPRGGVPTHRAPPSAAPASSPTLVEEEAPPPRAVPVRGEGAGRFSPSTRGAQHPRVGHQPPPPSTSQTRRAAPRAFHSLMKPFQSARNKKPQPLKTSKTPKTKQQKKGRKQQKQAWGGRKREGAADSTHRGHEAVRPAARTQYGSGGMCQGAAAPCAAAAAPPSPPPHGNREQPAPRSAAGAAPRPAPPRPAGAAGAAGAAGLGAARRLLIPPEHPHLLRKLSVPPTAPPKKHKFKNINPPFSFTSLSSPIAHRALVYFAYFFFSHFSHDIKPSLLFFFVLLTKMKLPPCLPCLVAHCPPLVPSALSFSGRELCCLLSGVLQSCVHLQFYNTIKRTLGSCSQGEMLFCG